MSAVKYNAMVSIILTYTDYFPIGISIRGLNKKKTFYFSILIEAYFKKESGLLIELTWSVNRSKIIIVNALIISSSG